MVECSGRSQDAVVTSRVTLILVTVVVNVFRLHDRTLPLAETLWMKEVEVEDREEPWIMKGFPGQSQGGIIQEERKV